MIRSTGVIVGGYALPVTLAIALAAAGVAPTTAQINRGSPSVPLPDAPQQEGQRPGAPVFRAAVTRVEISALVLDRDGKPIRGLMAADFEVLENGVPQVDPLVHAIHLRSRPAGAAGPGIESQRRGPAAGLNHRVELLHVGVASLRAHPRRPAHRRPPHASGACRGATARAAVGADRSVVRDDHESQPSRRDTSRATDHGQAPDRRADGAATAGQDDWRQTVPRPRRRGRPSRPLPAALRLDSRRVPRLARRVRPPQDGDPAQRRVVVRRRHVGMDFRMPSHRP